MIEIIVHSFEEKISISGLISLGCTACEEAMKTGHGNKKACETCNKKDIKIIDAYED
jgi:hypothetical protein